MKTLGRDRTLESSRFFPYIAWTLIIGFAVFVFNITQNLRAAAEDLKSQSEYMQPTVKTPLPTVKGGAIPDRSQ